MNNKNNDMAKVATGKESASESVYSFQYLAIIPLSENAKERYSKNPNRVDCVIKLLIEKILPNSDNILKLK